jgi:hypothetical protein
MAGLVRYTITLVGKDKLTLLSRPLDEKPGSEKAIITLKPEDGESRIVIRVGNSPGIFPPKEGIPVDPDRHFHVYYDFLRIKGTSDNVFPENVFRPLPFRTGGGCGGSTEPTINCGGTDPCPTCAVAE